MPIFAGVEKLLVYLDFFFFFFFVFRILIE